MSGKKVYERAASFKEYKKQAKTAAKDLCYDDEVIKQINNAKTEQEITQIMRTARGRGETK